MKSLHDSFELPRKSETLGEHKCYIVPMDCVTQFNSALRNAIERFMPYSAFNLDQTMFTATVTPPTTTIDHDPGYLYLYLYGVSCSKDSSPSLSRPNHNVYTWSTTRPENAPNHPKYHCDYISGYAVKSPKEALVKLNDALDSSEGLWKSLTVENQKCFVVPKDNLRDFLFFITGALRPLGPVPYTLTIDEIPTA